MALITRLTLREKEILGILIRGRLDKEIASDLGISLDTVKKHNKSIYRKLNVRNRSEVIALVSTLDISETIAHRP